MVWTSESMVGISVTRNIDYSYLLICKFTFCTILGHNPTNLVKLAGFRNVIMPVIEPTEDMITGSVI